MYHASPYSYPAFRLTHLSERRRWNDLTVTSDEGDEVVASVDVVVDADGTDGAGAGGEEEGTVFGGNLKGAGGADGLEGVGGRGHAGDVVLEGRGGLVEGGYGGSGGPLSVVVGGGYFAGPRFEALLPGEAEAGSRDGVVVVGLVEATEK